MSLTMSLNNEFKGITDGLTATYHYINKIENCNACCPISTRTLFFIRSQFSVFPTRLQSAPEGLLGFDDFSNFGDVARQRGRGEEEKVDEEIDHGHYEIKNLLN